MTNSPDWTWNDGWILMSLFLTSGNDGSRLQDIIAASDAMNHAIPTRRELSRALSKLIQCDLITIVGDKYLISSEYLPGIQKAHEGRGGLFMSPEKGFKWLKKSGLSFTNNIQVELTDKEVKSAYQAYINRLNP